MSLSAREVAAVIRQRLPGVGVKKLHKLLYYCQGHHLAALGEPLFSELLSAWDMGPVVGQLWKAEKDGALATAFEATLTEGQLNTIGYVLSRYGGLSGRDLEILTHHEEPWLKADALRPIGESARIELADLSEFFAAATTDHEQPEELNVASVNEWLRSTRLPPAVTSDTPESIRSRMHV